MTSSTPTAYAVSPDSGEHWTAEGAWQVAEGIHRIPLPLPMDGLKAINVYVISTDDGLVLVDGGWAIPEARELLDRCLRSIGSGFGDIRRFLVTHIHRDHYTMATVLGHELGADVALGIAARSRRSTCSTTSSTTPSENPFARVLGHRRRRRPRRAVEPGQRRPGAADLSPVAVPRHLARGRPRDPGRAPAPSTPSTRRATRPATTSSPTGPTGCCSPATTCCRRSRPSIGFTVPPTPDPLGDFMASLTKVRGLPDLQILPAHGPVAPSSHARVDELLAFHEQAAREVAWPRWPTGRSTPPRSPATSAGPATSTHYDELDVFSRGMAAMETKAHLELLVARGQATRSEDADGVVTFALRQPGSGRW